MKIKITYIPECSPILEEWIGGDGKIHLTHELNRLVNIPF